MQSREILIRDLFAFALGLGLTLIALIWGALMMSGIFTWIAFARAILITGLLAGVIEGFVIQHAMRETHTFGPLATWRRVDRTQGCSVALLGALIAAGLLLCGGLMELLLEWR